MPEARFAAGLRWLRGPGLWTAIVVALWLVVALPFALGERTLVQRDVFTTHLPYKSFGAAELARGGVPAFFPEWALGQPFAGNPNALPYYPGNLLYLVLPFWPAFNLHYFGHLLLAFLGMRALGRALGQREQAAALAGLAYAGSGWMASALTFYNLLAVSAWAAWALAGLAKGGRRGAIGAGLAGGLALLAGEPITAALAIPAALYVAVSGHGARRGLGLAAAAGALGVAVALPQLVATARVLSHTFRGAHGLVLGQVTANELQPWRLLELLLPIPWGLHSAPPPWGHWATALSPFAPYVLSLHVGVVALLLALFAVGRRWPWAALAAGAVVVGALAGLSAEATAAATFGWFRYPQKLVFPMTLALAPLAGFGLEAALERRERARLVQLAGAIVAVFGLALLSGRAALAARLADGFAPGAPRSTLMAQAFLWSLQVVVAGVLIALAGTAIGRRRAGALVGIQLAAIAPLAMLVPSVAVDRFAGPPAWASLLDRGASVVSVPNVFPPWEPRPAYERAALWPGARQELDRELLAPSFAAPLGLASPLAPDLEGLSAPLHVFLLRNLAGADWPARIRWLRRLGTAALTREVGAPGPALERLAAARRLGVEHELLRVPSPRPFAFRPRRAIAAATPADAFVLVASGAIADDVATVARPVEQAAEGAVRVVSRAPGEIVIEVEGGGGVVGVLRAAHPLWRAALEDGTRLETTVVDLVLLGVEVPPGIHRVRLWAPRTPEVVAGALALVSLAGALLVAWRAR